MDRFTRRLPVRQRPNCGVGTPIPGPDGVHLGRLEVPDRVGPLTPTPYPETIAATVAFFVTLTPTSSPDTR